MFSIMSCVVCESSTISLEYVLPNYSYDFSISGIHAILLLAIITPRSATVSGDSSAILEQTSRCSSLASIVLSNAP